MKKDFWVPQFWCPNRYIGHPNNMNSSLTGAIDVKMNGSVLKERPDFKMLGLTFSSKLDWGSYIISIAKTASKEIGALIASMKFLFSGVAQYLYKCTLSPYMEYCCHVCWLVMSTWNCYVSYKNGYAGLLVFHLLPLLNSWLIIKM